MQSAAHYKVTSLADGANLDSVITIPSLRDYLGVYSDDDDDGLIAELLSTAANHVEGIVGRPVAKRQIIEFFDAWYSEYQLKFDQVSDLVFEYVDDNGDTQVFAAASYVIDQSATPNVVHVPTLPTAQLHKYTMLPVTIKYNYEMNAREMAQVRLAVKHLVNQLYYSRGDTVANLDDRYLYRILQGVRARECC